MTEPLPSPPPLVSVIIPAHNAEETLAETLESVRAQTYANLEVLVIDDGSVDGTHELASRIALGDQRIRVLAQPNAGVAAARNHGIREAKGAYLAFLDADDLWSPEKIEAQVARMRESGRHVGLVYCWSAAIDEDGIVLADWDRPSRAGKVFTQLQRCNFVGNGSVVLVRKEIAQKIGGFETRLREAGAQGCEDVLFYLKAARECEFALVREHQVGYRRSAANMSSDWRCMLRSYLLVTDEMERIDPRLRRHMRAGVARYGFWLFLQMLSTGRFGEAWRFLVYAQQQRSGLAIDLLMNGVGCVVLLARKRVASYLRRAGFLPTVAPCDTSRFGRRFTSAPRERR